MIVSITKIELISYSKLIAFFKFNGQIIKELQQSNCKKHKVTGSWKLKVWYTMTLWENENDINDKIQSIHSRLKITHGTLDEEFPEQKMAVRYLTGNEKVLEIGGNIGRNSLIFNYNILNIKFTFW